MSILLALKLALTSITRNKLRTFLTLIGLIMGIASVVSIYTIGTGLKNMFSEQFESLGTNSVIILPFKLQFSRGKGRPPTFQKINFDDVEHINRKFGKRISLIVPKLNAGGIAKYKNKSMNITISGVTVDFFLMGDKELNYGSFFSLSDIDRAQNVAILGSKVYEELFGMNDALNKNIVVGQNPYKVIGVLKEYPKGKIYFGELDREVVIPYTAFIKNYTNKDTATVSEIRIIASDGEKVETLKEDIRQYLRKVKKVKPDDDEKFSVQTAKQFLTTIGKLISDFISFLSVVAFISLFIGGIGIMNIMLVSVSERIKEIGIRISLGASQKDIILQFLIEAVILCFAGGIIGVLLAFPVSSVITKLMNWPTKISPSVIALSLFYSCLIGIVFGTYPAVTASKLDPIEALRSE